MVTLVEALVVANLCAVAAEWTYVILWSRRISRLLPKPKPRKAEVPDHVVTPPPPAPANIPAPTATAAVPFDPENIDLDSPIAQSFMGRIAASIGVDPAVVR